MCIVITIIWQHSHKIVYEVLFSTIFKCKTILTHTHLHACMYTHTHRVAHLLSTPRTDCDSVSYEPLVVRISVTVVLMGEGTATDWTDGVATL